MIRKRIRTAEAVHAALVQLARPLIENYVDDLMVHDLRTIGTNPEGCPFLHFTRSTGTYMIMLLPADAYPAKGVRVPFLFGTADREHLLDSAFGLVDQLVHDGNHTCHYYDGSTVRPITRDKALSLIAEYRHLIECQWRQGINPAKPVEHYLGLGM